MMDLEGVEALKGAIGQLDIDCCFNFKNIIQNLN